MAVADTELLVLFEDWLDELEAEIISLAPGQGTLTPQDLAKKLGLSTGAQPFSSPSCKEKGNCRSAPEVIMENRRTTILAFLAIILTLGILWQANRPVAVQEATMAQVRAEAARGDYRLIDTAALAKTPAVMVGEEIVVEGADVAEDKLEAVICRHLDLPSPEPKQKGLFGRFFGK